MAGKKKKQIIYPKLTRESYYFIDGRIQPHGLAVSRIPTNIPVAMDFETISLDNLQAYSVAFAWKDGEQIHSVVYNLADYLEQGRKSLGAFFAQCKAIIGHNTMFELRVLYHNGFNPFVLGGKIEDSMALSFVLDTGKEKDLKTICAEVDMALGAYGAFGTEKEFIKYNRDDAVASLKLYYKYLPTVHRMNCYPAYRLEVEAIWPFLKMWINGFKVDVEKMKQFEKDGQAKIDDFRTQLLQLAGKNLNLNSGPQLRILLYNDWGITPDKDFFTKGGKKGDRQPGTNKSAIAKLATRQDVPERAKKFCETMLQYTKFTKLINTFTGEEFQKHIHMDGKIRSSMNSVGTATGRPSSSEPNMLNIPKRGEEGSHLRSMYIASDDAHTILDFDWSQIEYRLFTHFSGDKKLIADYQNPKADFHVFTAELMGIQKAFGITAKEARDIAKSVNFMLIFQGGINKLARMIGKSVTVARDLYNLYFELLAGTKKFMEIAKAYAHYTGYTRTISGKIRRMEKPRQSENGADDRVAVNTPVQGGCADLMKLVMIELDRKIPCGIGKNDVKMVLQVYDELIFDCPKSRVEETCAIIKETMEGVYKFTVPLIAEGGSGANWMEAKES